MLTGLRKTVCASLSGARGQLSQNHLLCRLNCLVLVGSLRASRPQARACTLCEHTAPQHSGLDGSDSMPGVRGCADGGPGTMWSNPSSTHTCQGGALWRGASGVGLTEG
eukprot:264219-Rhodomonas_salina.3